MKELNKDFLNIKIYDSRAKLGIAAANDAAAYINKLLETQEETNILFAAAPSQNEFLLALIQHQIPWERINAFHMDEYIGLKREDPQRFGNYLEKYVIGKVRMKSAYYLFNEVISPEDACTAYSKKLDNHPLDIIFMGIGENGHIAFNDPHVALFDDPEQVKIVSLDEACRKQQVHDGCFGNIEDVPQKAITLTIPAMMKAKRIFCIVPAASKANAIAATVNGEISHACPASILRKHRATTLYCDSDSAKHIL